MSSYLRGYDGYYPHSHFREPISAGPLASYDYDDDDFSSDFDVVERDIDAEIEARLRHEPPRARLSPPPLPPAPRTVSQRMLQSLQQQRAQNRAAASLPPRRRSSSRVVERTLGDSMYDLRSVLNEDASAVSTERLTDTFDTPLSSRSGGSSCTDRLEARISKSFLARRDSGPGLAAVNEGQDVSMLYSGRRTYPAESLRKTEHARMSDNRTTPQETKMKKIMEKERATRVFRSQVSCPEVPAEPKKDNGVRFHFRRGSSVDNDVLNVRMGRLALTNGTVDGGAETSLVRAQPVKRVTDPEYTALASQLAEIEVLVDGIENYMKTPSFSTLAVRVLKEMELLTTTTQQIRTNGTTLILANVGKHQNADFTQALRRLVARAASVQKRISALMHVVKKLVV
ncbi:hypothetical protein F441_17565 [Phytophthora nicotianae CJ01A1]|uniref:Uncharacterized protein n=4 Tax=Phytophthora nicotianae TaxID=4792 RepID=W2YGW2_PHYNI|nr:hypothetical protein L915_17228 [Phytophthora nicotianae]ETL83019.1 hypothetical protein L917_16947 [Phytophthora nicotianae]ETO64852.1 hypothetical protein F444_17730 [Phytophthora nicotianae P1976]ETP05959.1 hypothetical protein F441_17565 [Phytophthora nicotianae CJ01A1]ETP34072.1 hypothetical protein F442_17546 [Phytophthora nicotianae P10297]